MSAVARAASAPAAELPPQVRRPRPCRVPPRRRPPAGPTGGPHHYRGLRLVTHARLPEALALYDALGYVPVAPFSEPWGAATETRWLGKAVGPGARPAAAVCIAALRPAPGA